MEMAAVEPVAADTNAADTNNAFEHAPADSNAALENELLALNANLSAATYRLLVLIRAFDCPCSPAPSECDSPANRVL